MREIPKRYYLAPEINSIKLDNNIVLLTPTGNPPGEAATSNKNDTPSFGPLDAPPSSTANPFGGSRPDYGDM